LHLPATDVGWIEHLLDRAADRADTPGNSITHPSTTGSSATGRAAARHGRASATDILRR
jgi:hypothetical protein